MFEGSSGIAVIDPEARADEMPLPIEYMSVDQALDEVKRTDTEIAKLHARQMQALARIAELRRDPDTGDTGFANGEIGFEMRWSPKEASRKLHLASGLAASPSPPGPPAVSPNSP